MFWSRFSAQFAKGVLILLGLIALMALASCGGDDDEEEFDEDEPVASAPTQAPAIPPTSPAAVPASTAVPSVASPGTQLQPSSSPSAPITATGDLPRLTTQVDLLFTDLNTGKLVFEI